MAPNLFWNLTPPDQAAFFGLHPSFCRMTCGKQCGVFCSHSEHSPNTTSNRVQIDITGVLKEGDAPIAGSIEAVKK